MAYPTLRKVMERYISGIVRAANLAGDQKVNKFFFSKGFNHGCGGHPDLADHQLIALELTGYLKTKMNW